MFFVYLCDFCCGIVSVCQIREFYELVVVAQSQLERAADGEVAWTRWQEA